MLGLGGSGLEHAFILHKQNRTINNIKGLPKSDCVTKDSRVSISVFNENLYPPKPLSEHGITSAKKVPMPALSVFDMLKIGVGPSSSHTLGPWRAIQRWLAESRDTGVLASFERIEIILYGSLALTGRGHCTDTAICLALLGYDPETVPVDRIDAIIADLQSHPWLSLSPDHRIPFNVGTDIIFRYTEQLPFHANGMTCIGYIGEREIRSTYYSVGGGFVVKESDDEQSTLPIQLPFPCETTATLLDHCTNQHMSISDMVWSNEQTWRTPDAIWRDLNGLWMVMKEGMHRGCHTAGVLPGGLHVRRRAEEINRKLIGDKNYEGPDEWIETIRGQRCGFKDTLRWVSCFALAVNEENANLGRVVTAPTNGAAGVIPAVLMYHICFSESPVSDEEIARFLMVAGEIGTFFKKRATISAAMGGCQAEIGVSSAMAAAALTEVQGGSVEQALMAAEIAMEHHLGLTCDPIQGLVQVPCIERNSMGAIKAINAAELALTGDPKAARVTLDEVIQTMWETAKDMNTKYKETSQGGLAVNISVRVPEC